MDIGALRVNTDFLFTRENFFASSSKPKLERYTLTSWRLSKNNQSSRPILKLEISSQLCRRELIG